MQQALPRRGAAGRALSRLPTCGVHRRTVLWAAVAPALTSAFATQAPAQTPQGDPPPSAQTPQTDPAATTPVSSETSIAASLSDTDRMLVSVTIGGAGPYPFIVDTAAERTVIARELAEELGLRPAGRARLLSVTSTRDAAKVHVPDVSFLPGRTQDLQAFTLQGRHVGASGVLGIDALRGQRVVLDFAARTLAVRPASRREEPLGPDEIVVNARRRFGQLVLADCTVDGDPVDVVVDSGLQVSLGNEALRRILTTRRNEFRPIELVSITGETLSADYTRADRLVIGTALLTGMPVAFANAHFFRRMRLIRRPALLLGMDALQLFARVSVDFPNRKAYFVFPDNVVRSRAPLSTR